jgi:hypothetical protein
MVLEPGEREVVNRVKEFFAKEPGFVFVRVAGTGAFGVTLHFQNTHAGPTGYRNIIVKAHNPFVDETLEGEIDFLKVATHFSHA